MNHARLNGASSSAIGSSGPIGLRRWSLVVAAGLLFHVRHVELQ